MTNIREGEKLFAKGKIEEAEKYFVEIADQDPDNKEAFNNLGVIAFQRQNLEQAVDYFTKSLEIDPFYKDAILNYSAVLENLNIFHESIPLLEKVIEKFPNDDEVSQLLDKARMISLPRRKIAVLCLPGLENFLRDIVNFLKIKYEVKTCYSNNEKELESAVKWSDIIWLEWANELAIALTHHPDILDGKKVICRLHSYEALGGYVKKIKWERICALVFVAEHIKEIVIKQVPRIPHLVRNIQTIPNGTNMDKFEFKERKKGWNIAYIGYINYKKGPMLLLHAFRELAQIDNRYHLFVAGVFQDARYDLYFGQMIKEMGLEKNIHLDGWVKDVNSWLDDKQYIICTSILESQGLSLMEAMACGLKPVIHNFVGARQIYPDKYLWNTIHEFVQKVTENDYSSKDYRSFIEENYSLKTQLDRIDRIVSDVAKTISTRNQTASNAKDYLVDKALDHRKESIEERIVSRG